jgi:hypothetical protein
MTRYNRYKRTLAYLLVIFGLVILAGAAKADAATKGSVSFKVGTERVDRTTSFVNADVFLIVAVYINGREFDLDETHGHRCLGYVYDNGVTVRLDSCKTGERMTVRAVNASDTTKRVTVKWEQYSAPTDGKRRG